MIYECLNFAVADGIATITIDRPEAANSLNLRLADEFNDVAIRCSSDATIRAVLLTSNGRMFCAGGDLHSFIKEGDRMDEHMRRVTTTFHAAVSRFTRMDAPLVVAVNGVAAGAGMSLAMIGDIILAAASARFTMAYTGIGVAPDGSSSFFLPRLVGTLKARELMLTNKLIGAEEALAIGLVTEVVPDAELMPRARACVEQFAQGPTKAYGEVKRLIADSLSNTLETQMEYETRAICRMAGETRDAPEGIAAFTEKRKPAFQGK